MFLHPFYVFLVFFSDFNVFEPNYYFWCTWIKIQRFKVALEKDILYTFRYRNVYKMSNIHHSSFFAKSVTFSVSCKIIKDCLPSLTLQLKKIHRFRIKHFSNFNLLIFCNKRNAHSPFVFETVLDELIFSNFLIHTFEIEPHTFVFRLYPTSKLSSDFQIIFCFRRVPFLGSMIPLLDVFRVRPKSPYFPIGASTTDDTVTVFDSILHISFEMNSSATLWRQY